MKNSDKPAYPVNDTTLLEKVGHGLSVGDYRSMTYGLSKREMFAMAAMQGICAGPVNSHQIGAKLIAKASIEIADELLKQLES